MSSIMAAIAVALQAQSTPPPPSGPLVHGFVQFDTASAEPIMRSQVDPIEYLGGRVPPDSFVYVQGHADTVGSDASNIALSQRRALMVADLLTKEGVNPERITIMSCGERPLRRPTPDEVSEPLNRSVTFDWSPTAPTAPSVCLAASYRR